MNLSKASSLSRMIRSHRSSLGSESCSEAKSVSSLSCEDDGICADVGMKSDAFDWEAGGEETGNWEAGSGASRASGSIEDDNEACEDACDDDCASIRGFFGLPTPLRCDVAGLLPLLPPVRVSPRGVLEALARPRKRVERRRYYLICLAIVPRGFPTANEAYIA